MQDAITINGFVHLSEKNISFHQLQNSESVFKKYTLWKAITRRDSNITRRDNLIFDELKEIIKMQDAVTINGLVHLSEKKV